MPATVALGDRVVAERGEVDVGQRREDLDATAGPGSAHRRGGQRAVVEDRPEPARSARPAASLTSGALPALATTRKRSSAEPVDDQVVEDPAVGGADHRVVGAADGERRRVRDERARPGRRPPPAPRRTARPCATGRTARPARGRPDAPRGSRRTGAASASRRTRSAWRRARWWRSASGRACGRVGARSRGRPRSALGRRGSGRGARSAPPGLAAARRGPARSRRSAAPPARRRSTQRTSSNSWSWRARSPPVGSIRK